MVIIGVDYHPSFQTIAFCVEETGESGEQELSHSDGQAEKFYRELKQRGASVRVGMEMLSTTAKTLSRTVRVVGCAHAVSRLVRDNFMCLKLLALDAVVIATLLAVSFAPAAGQIPTSMQGQVRNGSYENSFFGLTFTPDAKLTFDTAEFAGSRTWTERTFLLFSAWTKEQIGGVRTGVVADADRLSDYPEGRRDGEAYINRVVRAQLGQGYEVVDDKKHRQLANTKFLEADFKRGSGSEAVLVTLRKGYAVVFIFNAASPTDLDNLISSPRIAFGD
jgi:hypothetical protein